MTEYWLEPESGCLCATPLSKTDLSFFTIMTINEFTKKEKESPNHKEILHNLGSIRYCKAERVSAGIIGTLRVPKKDAGHTPQMSFCFYLTEENLLFIEETGDLKKWMENQIESIHNIESPDQLLVQLLGQIVEPDTLYLLHLEKEIFLNIPIDIVYQQTHSQPYLSLLFIFSYLLPLFHIFDGLQHLIYFVVVSLRYSGTLKKFLHLLFQMFISL